MADAKISALTGYTTPITTDVMPIVDVTNSETKKITIANLKTAVASVPTTITVANEATDTTCFPLFVTAATGDLGPKTNANMTFNSSTGALGASSISTSLAGTPATFTNTTDAASNQGIIIQSDRATMAANDEVYASFRLSDSAGNQDEFARITASAIDVTSTSEDGQLDFSVVTNGTLTKEMRLYGTNLIPFANDGLALGQGTNGWADLFLASGGVINFNNGNVTLTHSAGILTQNAGELRITSANVGTNADSVPTLSSTNTLTNKRITKRTGTTTSSATPTINTDNVDFYSLTAQAADITSFTTNLSGTPTEGQTLWIAITGTAARAITWGSSFEASTVALPTTTVSTNRLDVGFVWNTVTSKWRCIASA